MGRSERSRRRNERLREEAAKEAQRVAAEAAASKVSLESTSSSDDSYVWSAERDRRAAAAEAAMANASASDVSTQSGSSKDSYIWSGQRDAMAAAAEAAMVSPTASDISAQSGSTDDSYIWSGQRDDMAAAAAAAAAVESGTGSRTAASLRKRPAVGNLSNASKQSLNSSAVPSQPVPATTQPETAPASAPVKLTASALATVPNQPPAELPNSRPQVWNLSHDQSQEEKRPPIVRPVKTEAEGGVAGSDFPSEGRLCVDAFEEAYKVGKEIDTELMRQVVDYYENQVEELVIIALEGRGKISEAKKIVQQKVEDVERKHQLYVKLLELKTNDEGWRHNMDKALNVVELHQLREEAKALKVENEDMKRKYAELEEEKKLDEEMHEVAQELIKDLEEEEKKKDEQIAKLEDELQRAKKEIALAGFAPRPKLRGSDSGINQTASYTSTVDSDDSTLEGSGSNVSNVSNASTDSSVSTANANIHLLEMSIFHSRKDFSGASRAAAKAEKYISSLDAKTQLAVKAWHASNVALSSSGENDNLVLAKCLFEDALFIAQGMKNVKGGKAYEDKCKAWLTHLADVEAKRTASVAVVAGPRETSEQRAGPRKGPKIYNENKCAPSRQDVLLGKAQAQSHGPEPAQVDDSATPRPLSPALPILPPQPQVLGNELDAAHFYSSSSPNNSDRSSQELPALQPQPLGRHLDAASELSSSPTSSAPPSSPPVRHSSQEWPTQLSRDLAAELAGQISSSPTSSSPVSSRDSETVLYELLPHGHTVVDIDIDEFSPSNVLDIHFGGSGGSSPEGSARKVVQDHDTEARPSSTRSSHFPRLFR